MNLIVVADTSPIHYLVLIDAVELLATLFGKVLLPRAVFEELNHPRTPEKTRRWMEHLPKWIEVRAVASTQVPALLNLDPGEREAIQLALELGIGTVLMDEADGRQQAEELHLEVRGTLGILQRGAKLGKIDLDQALSKLEQTNFRLSPAVRAALFKRNP